MWFILSLISLKAPKSHPPVSIVSILDKLFLLESELTVVYSDPDMLK